MAISISNLTSGGSSTSGTSFVTASISASNNALVLASIATRTGISTDPVQPTLSGAGLTWVVVNSVVYDTTSSSRRRVTTFRGLGTPSAGALTFSLGAQTNTGASWVVDQATGVDISGTNGSGAVVQSVTNFDGSASVNTLTVTLAAFSSSNNATYGVFGDGDPINPPPTAGSGFTLLASFAQGTETETGSEWKVANDTSVDISYSGNREIGGIAIEIKQAVPASLIKSINGLAIASVKSINGLAIASVKTINGLTNV